MKKRWSGREIMLLRVEYPVGGLAGCVAVLPNRSVQAIYIQAGRMGLSAPPYPLLKHVVAEAARLREEVRSLRKQLA